MKEDLYEKVLTKYGRAHQLRMLQEECAETIVAVNHVLRGREKENVLIEELADLEIMCGQMRLIYGSYNIDVAKIKKLDRLSASLIAKEK